MTPELKMDPWAMEAAKRIYNSLPSAADPTDFYAFVIQNHHNAAGWGDFFKSADEYVDFCRGEGTETDGKGRFARFQEALAKLKEGK